MSLIRKEIRQDFVDLIKGKTSAGDKVFNSRDLKYPAENLPAIFISTTDDYVDVSKTIDHHKRKMFRNVSLEVEIVISRNTENYQDTLDTIADEVSYLIFLREACANLHPCINILNYEGDSSSFDANAECTIANLVMRFDIEYYKENNLKPDDLNQLKSIISDMNLIQGKVEYQD